MTKKKHFHSLSGKGKGAAAYAFFHRRAPAGSKALPRQKKAAADAANIDGGKVEQTLTGTVSASNDNKETEETQA